jgi:hypothetical protein
VEEDLTGRILLKQKWGEKILEEEEEINEGSCGCEGL